MSNVIQGGWNDTSGKGGDNGSGNPPGDGGLEKRIEALEKAIPELREKLVRVETKLETIEKSMATKDDLRVIRGEISTEMHKSLNDQTWRFIGFAGALAALAFTAAKFIH